ncbi:MAG: NINE protein [Cyanosarcina radialis HA8281-LM2]|jgi:TM2 domain-containing membrane protein YozV|nr:NINE protein [Cyanosarcina radialis HA8281-LM2]
MATSPNDKAIEAQSTNNVGTSYLLWLACLLQIHGLHRFYNKQYVTGVLWLFTFGLFWMGQFADLFLMSRMVEDHNQKMRAKLGLSPLAIPLPPDGAIAMTARPLTADELMVKLVKAAAKRGGKISVTQAVMDTGVSFAEVEATLKQMVKSRYVEVDNHPETGVIIYDFIEL